MLSQEFKVINDGLRQYTWLGGWEDYSNGDVFLWRREAGQRIITKVEKIPRYFCIDKKDYKKTDKWPDWKKAGFFDRGVIGNRYAYIYIPDDVYGAAYRQWLITLDDMGIKPLEGNASRLQRLLVEMDLKVCSPSDPNGPRTVFYDIETDDRSSKIEIGKERILSIAAKDGQTGEEVFFQLEEFTNESERKMLVDFLRHIVKYDVLIGYNNAAFDDEYVEHRFSKLKIDQSLWKRLAKLDMFILLERQHTFDRYAAKDRKLDTISKAVLGRGKVPHAEGIYELWDTNKSLLRDYNVEDVRLIFDMEDKLHTIRLVSEVCSIAGLLHSSGYSPYRVIEMMLFRNAEENRRKGIFDFRYPTGFYRPEHNFGKYNKSDSSADKRVNRKAILKDEFDIDLEQIEGGLVLEVSPGLHRNVYVTDYNSLYPNTMRAFRIGYNTYLDEPETFSGPKTTAPNGVSFRADVPGDLETVVENLLTSRAQTKAMMKGINDKVQLVALDVRQNALKEIANSCYGVLGLWGGAFYNKKLGEAVTSGGRTFLPFAVEFFGSIEGCSVVAGDTDSFFVRVPEGTDINPLVDKYLEKLRAFLKERFNVYRPEVLKVSVEKCFASILIIKKKNYAGRVSMLDGQPADKVIIKGLRAIKGNTSKWAAKLANSMLNDILTYNYGADHYQRVLSEERARLSAGQVDYKELIISARIGKPVEEYESELVHVRIAKRMIENGIFIPPHATINYIVTNGDSKLDGIEEREITRGSVFDVSYYWNHDFMPQAETYLETLFPEIDWTQYRFPKNYKRNPFRCEAPIIGAY